MEKINHSFEKMLNYAVYGALIVFALALVTSTSLLSLTHILMIIPALYFLPKVKYKEFSKSSWFLLAMTFVIIISVIFNQDIATRGLSPILKSKYFFFGFISIAPIAWWAKNYLTDKKISILLYTFCVATTFATIAGIIGMKTGYNYVSMRVVNLGRNAGLSGMVLNYAHNLAFFQVIILGLIIFKNKTKEYINSNFVLVIFIMNLIGLYMSYTRGAMLALIVGAPFYFFKKNKTRFILVAAVLVALAGGVYAVSGKSILRPDSDRERISQWRAALMAFKERPVLGYGYLNFENYSVPIKKRYNLGELQFGGHAHNNFLEMLASTGILGFLCYTGWLIAWFIEMYKRDDLIANISLPFIIVFMVSGLTQSTISLGVNLFFVMAAYAIGQTKFISNLSFHKSELIEEAHGTRNL